MKGSIAALAVGIAVTACGGGGSDQPDSQPSGPVCKATVSVQLYGDSTQMFAFQDGKLQAEMDAKFGVGKVLLIDQSANGKTSQQLIDGTDGKNTPWPQNLTADIAMVNHGINDAVHTTLAQYTLNMKAFAAGNGVTRMVIETPNPVLLPHAQTDTYAAIGRQVAAEAGLPLADVQSYVLGLPDWQDTSMLYDGVHPTPELEDLLAKNATGPVLEPIIASMLCR